MAAILEDLFSKNLKLLHAIIILTYSMGTISFRGSFFMFCYLINVSRAQVPSGSGENLILFCYF